MRQSPQSLIITAGLRQFYLGQHSVIFESNFEASISTKLIWIYRPLYGGISFLTTMYWGFNVTNNETEMQLCLGLNVQTPNLYLVKYLACIISWICWNCMNDKQSIQVVYVGARLQFVPKIRTKIYILGNKLSPRQNGRHIPADFFKCIFVNRNIWISSRGPLNNISGLL